MQFSQPFPAPFSIKSALPLSKQHQRFVNSTRQQVRAILSGQDSRWLVIMGPCSIHDTTAALEYANKLRHLSDKVSDRLYIVMRTYYEKSRTSDGWKGFLHDPYLDGSCHLLQGIQLTRRLLLDILDLNIPVAAEALDPLTSVYFSDILSWACIGARTATSQIHRQLASGLPIPVGVKNSTDGNIDHAVHGAYLASLPHHYLNINEAGCIATTQTKGNTDAHIVLRGGQASTNYDPSSIYYAAQKLATIGLNQRFLIDCSHGNSQRNPLQQADVFYSLLSNYEKIHTNVCGVILESHLYSGQQPLHALSCLQYGVSITDPCLGWEESEQLILDVYDQLHSKKCIDGIPMV